MASFAYSFLLLLSSSHALQKDESTICAIGDLHGDANHALQAFQLCNVVDGDGRWSGGAATVIQTGDVLDRGNASLPLLYWLWSLREQAAAAGGDLVLMMGNHELLNMQGKTYYVDADELSGFGGKEAWKRAMHPQHGEIGHKLSAQPGVAVRGAGACRTLFLHAGLRLDIGQHYGSVENLNAALTSQVRSEARGDLLDSHYGPLWWRGYARPHAAGLEESEACAEARAAIASFGDGAVRMAVGHNIVPFVSSRCNGAVQMIDVGMSTAYGGRPAAWRCSINGESGAAEVRALYLEGEEPPPDLCDACDEARRPPVHPLRGGDPHGDCRNYCRYNPRRLGSGGSSSSAGGGGGAAAAAAATTAEGGGGGGSWSRLFAALGGGSGGGDAQQQPAVETNHVKTEF